jgi:hypothetical protein
VSRSKSIVREKVNALISRGLVQALKASGYRRTGLNFSQEATPTAVRLLNLQLSRWNAARNGELTINLGVYHRDLAALHDSMSVCETPLTADCVVQQRIVFLMPVKRDFWWKVDEQTDVDALGSKTAFAWSEYAKPWLDAHTSLSQARDFLVSQDHFMLAAMASLALGQRANAEKWLAVALKNWPEGAQRLEAWWKKHLGRTARKKKR